MARAVVTGAPHAGKTTLLTALQLRGFRVLPEAALTVIESLVHEHGAEGARQWRASHAAEFQRIVTLRQIELEQQAEDDDDGGSLVLCDRGWPDGVAYAAMDGLPPDAVFEAGRALPPYVAVFVLAIIEPFDARAESGRVSGEARARETHQALLRAYISQGYDPVDVPSASLEHRVHLVMRHLDAWTGGGAANGGPR